MKTLKIKIPNDKLEEALKELSPEFLENHKVIIDNLKKGKKSSTIVFGLPIEEYDIDEYEEKFCKK